MRKKSNSVSVGRSLEALASSSDVVLTDYLDHRKRKLNQYIRGERVGKGRHGEVFIGRDTLHNHREVAIKIVKRSNPKDKFKLLRRNYQQTDGSTNKALNSTENSIRREIAVMKHLRHPNLAALLEVIDDPREDRIYLIMEYISGGIVEWTDPIDHLPLLTLSQTRRVMRDVILGLEYLHCIGIVHRDVKPSNIMYTANRASVKLIDFGISHIILPPAPKKEKDDAIDPDLRELFPTSDLKKRIGTPSFLAPEVVWFSDDSSQSKDRISCETVQTASSHGALDTVVVQTFPMPKARPPITPAIDLWSLGVTLYCLLFGHTPFNGSSSENQTEFMLYHQICTQDWRPEELMGAEQVETGGRHPTDPSSDGFSVMQLLDGMLQKYPTDRISLQHVKNHPFILEDVLNAKEWLRLTASVSPFPDNESCWSWRRAARKIVSVLKG